MNQEEPGAFVVLAANLATEATEMARGLRASAKTFRKSDNSVVTEADEEIQRHILDGIQARYPAHAFLAEESSTAKRPAPVAGHARFCWVVDPIDGTRNYVAGFPCHSTSIAVLDQGRPVASVVLEHNLGDCYTAALGQGATHNGTVVQVDTPAAGNDWLLGIPSTKDPLTVRVVQLWLQTRGYVLRNTGSTALHLAMVGAGALTGAFARRCKIWDIAAGALIVEEAGGIITSPTGDSLFPYSFGREPNADIPFLAASPTVHQALIESIKS